MRLLPLTSVLLVLAVGVVGGPVVPPQAGAAPAAVVTRDVPPPVEPTDFGVALESEWGTSHLWTPEDDVAVQLQGDPAAGYLDVVVTPAGEQSYSIRLRAPYGQSLTEGRYDDTAAIGDARTPSMTLGFQGSACTEPTGSFVVHRLTQDLSTVSITFRNTCRGTVGEISVGLSDPGAELTVLPSRIDWNPRRVGTASEQVPVRVSNTSGRAVTVADAVLTEGADHYRVDRSDCRTLVAGASCLLEVVHRPTGGQDGRRDGRVEVTTAEGPGAQVVMTADDLAGTWSVDAVGDDGHRYVADVDDLDARSGGPRSVTTVDNGVPQPGRRFSLRIHPPSGESFVPGRTYVGGDRGDPRFAGLAGFDLAVDSSSCPGSTGTFRIGEIAFDGRDRLQRLSLTFYRRCSDGEPTVRGAINVHVQSPLAVPPADPVVTPGQPPAPAPAPDRASRVVLFRPDAPAGAPATLRVGGQTRVAARIEPVLRSGCLSVRTQVRRAGEWRTRDVGPCRTPDTRGTVRRVVSAEGLRAGSRLRVQGQWRAPGGQVGARSSWLALRVVPRS